MKTKRYLIILLLSLPFLNAYSQRLRIDSLSTTNPTSCSICNGTAFAIVTGGFTPYTYVWSNGSTTNPDTGLCAGNYGLTVFDSRGDSAARPFRINPGTSLNATTNDTNPNCTGGKGYASISVSGGILPYTYSWSTGATTSSISGLSSGGYTVTATDSAGCTVTKVFNLTAGLTLKDSVVNVSCNGGNNGSATITSVSGGLSPYTYLWSPFGGTSSSATGLSAGTYTATVMDAGGCTGIDTIVINQPPLLQIDSGTIIHPATCSNNNGGAIIHVSGGLFPYTYSWAPLANSTANVSNLSAGTYTVYITDRNGCSASQSVIIPSSGPVPHLATTNDSCYGGSNGTAIVNTVTGGTAPFTYLWTPSGSTNRAVSNLSAGTYTLTVTDSTGCSGTNSVIITQPAQLVAIIDTSADTGSCTGSALIIVTGGTGPFTYSWSTTHVTMVADSFGQTADSLCYGSYLLCITDANGCSTCDSVHIRHAPHITGIANIDGNAGLIKLFPDPVSTSLTIQTSGMKSGNYNFSVYDLIGREVIHLENITVTPGKSIPLNVTQIPSGKYMLRIFGGNLNQTAPFVVTH